MINILFSHRNKKENLKYYLLSSDISLIEGYGVHFWDRGSESMFDAVISKKPDAIMMNDLDYEMGEWMFIKNEFPQIKIVWVTDLDRTSQHEGIDRIIKTNKINSIKENFLPYLHSDSIFNGGSQDEMYDCDFLIMTDNMDMENNKIQKIVKTISATYRVKIYGSKSINIANYLGEPNQNEYKDIINSCKSMILFDDSWINTCFALGKKPIIMSNVDASDCLEFNTLTSLIDKMDNIDNIDVNNSKHIYMGSYKKWGHRFLVEELGL